VRPRCRCEPKRIERYRARISGPLLDRIDLQVSLPPVDTAALTEVAFATASPEFMTSATAAAQVCEVRRLQLQRQGVCNARLGPEQTLLHCRADAKSTRLLQEAARVQGLSARSQHRILRVARSIADLAGRDAVAETDVAEALALRWQD
jgi:magnesium chelatase family protein